MASSPEKVQVEPKASNKKKLPAGGLIAYQQNDDCEGIRRIWN
jgi:hypothetical protein